MAGGWLASPLALTGGRGHFRQAGPGAFDKLAATAIAPTTSATPMARVRPGRCLNQAIIGAHGPASHLAVCSTGNNAVSAPSPIPSMTSDSTIRTCMTHSSLAEGHPLPAGRPVLRTVYDASQEALQSGGEPVQRTANAAVPGALIRPAPGREGRMDR